MAKKGGAPTKSEIVAQICKDSELSRKQVAAVFESLNGIIKKSLRGPGLFTLPGLLKMKVVKKPATKAREGINPFTKEKMVFKAKPASEEPQGPRELSNTLRASPRECVLGKPDTERCPGFLAFYDFKKSRISGLSSCSLPWKKWPAP
jgi:DNA-binding protein HU-beta